MRSRRQKVPFGVGRSETKRWHVFYVQWPNDKTYFELYVLYLFFQTRVCVFLSTVTTPVTTTSSGFRIFHTYERACVCIVQLIGFSSCRPRTERIFRRISRPTRRPRGRARVFPALVKPTDSAKSPRARRRPTVSSVRRVAVSRGHGTPAKRRVYERTARNDTRC